MEVSGADEIRLEIIIWVVCETMEMVKSVQKGDRDRKE